MENNEVNSQTNPSEVENVENVETSANAESVQEEVKAAASSQVDLDAAREELKSRRTTSEDEEAELNRAMADADLDAAMKGSIAAPAAIEAGAKISVTVVSVSQEKDSVFVEAAGNVPGVLSFKQFKKEPEVGASLTVTVTKETNEDGMFEANVPGAAISHADWSQVQKDMVVEAVITGSNTGGLQCKVNNLPGFIPISQIAPQRVENLDEFVGQKFECIVTEVDSRRRNLVLSRRRWLDRQRNAQRDELFAKLAPGQIYNGIVRKIMDFGAFIDIGGIDGLLHISQISWDRIKHPSDVLKEGQEIQVQVEKIDPEKKKISFAYRDMMRNPWGDVEKDHPEGSVVTGKVTKIMPFGAFIEIEPGIEGLVHISALSHSRVKSVEDVLTEGKEVSAKVMSVDVRAHRISLSIKALTEDPNPEKEGHSEQREQAPVEVKGGRPRPRGNNLKGGCGGDGNRFG